MYQVPTFFISLYWAYFIFLDILFIVLAGACLSSSPAINNVGIVILDN